MSESHVVEAIVTPAPDYAGWVPAFGPVEGKPGGKALRFTVELRNKKNPAQPVKQTAWFRYILDNTSKEPGRCLNSKDIGTLDGVGPTQTKSSQQGTPKNGPDGPLERNFTAPFLQIRTFHLPLVSNPSFCFGNPGSQPTRLPSPAANPTSNRIHRRDTEARGNLFLCTSASLW